MLTQPEVQEHPIEKRCKNFVAISRFEIANEMRDEIAAAFQNRPHLVDQAAGFIGMDVMRPVDNPDEIWLITFWTDKNSFDEWHHSHLYKASHKGIPKGLKLVPKSASIRYFDYISD